MDRFGDGFLFVSQARQGAYSCLHIPSRNDAEGKNKPNHSVIFTSVPGSIKGMLCR